MENLSLKTLYETCKILVNVFFQSFVLVGQIFEHFVVL